MIRMVAGKAVDKDTIVQFKTPEHGTQWDRITGILSDSGDRCEHGAEAREQSFTISRRTVIPRNGKSGESAAKGRWAALPPAHDCRDIPPGVVESAQALGLPSRARLRIVELPLATRAILAGIKTSAVINVGTATLGALIGAGGYGQPFLTGIRLDDNALILQGAVPAAVLALLAQGLFELIERRMLPRGLRIQASRRVPSNGNASG